MTELTFMGKEFVYNHHLCVPFRPLCPDSSKGIGEVRTDESLIIHGDNLHALKALLPTHGGRVDCVFIDPPYNTGNEGWKYNDNVNAPMIREWLEANSIGVEDGLRHDKWCCMMWPRLRLLHELLTEEGTIWVTLDSNEMHRAKLMLDEIFGEQNHLGTLVWEKSDSPRMDTGSFSSRHDFILVFAKNDDNKIFNRLQVETPQHYNKTDEDGRKYYTKPLRKMGVRGDTRESSPSLYYSIPDPDGNPVFPKRPDGTDGCWRWGKAKYTLESHRIEWSKGKNGWTPNFKIYEDTQRGRPPETIWYNVDVGSSRTASREINEIFGTPAFETPKPMGLLLRVMEIATNSNSIVLDSFAGSATTAHAVMKANAADNGNRKFILVEMEDYADTLTAERVRRVANGYRCERVKSEVIFSKRISWRDFQLADKFIAAADKVVEDNRERYDIIEKVFNGTKFLIKGSSKQTDMVAGLGGTFTYCTLGAAISLDSLLGGEELPAFEAMGAILFSQATNQACDTASVREDDFYLGETEDRVIWMLYKPCIQWLKSTESALTLNVSRKFSDYDNSKSHLVFASARFVSRKLLSENGLNVEYIPLPFAVQRSDWS